jgi:hypothetical protein
MRRTLWSIIIFFTFTLSYLFAEQGEIPTTSGTITGRVLNRTFDGRFLADHIVRVQSYRGAAQSTTAETRTDKKGRFIFRNLETDPNIMYIMITSYGDIEYFSEPIFLDRERPNGEADLAIYEESEDGSNIVVDNLHLIMRRGEWGVHVQEIMAVRNTVPYTYLGTEGLSMLITPPGDAQNLTLGPGLEDMNITVQDGAVYVYEPIHPKGQQLLWSYDIPVDKKSYSLVRVLDYNTKSIDVLLGIPGAHMESEQLQPQETFVVDEDRYSHISGRDIDFGTKVVIMIENLPRAGINLIRAGILAAVAFLSAVTIVYIYAFRQKDPYTDRFEQLSKRRRALVAEIAMLDNDFSRGSIQEPVYRTIRDEKKQLLLDVAAQLRIRSLHL